MVAPPAFQSRNPLEPGFWDERFERGFMPWDRGGVPQALQEFVAASSPMTTLIPGCGAAYELAYLADAGWDATAIDFSPAAVAKARAGLPEYASRVVEADFFAFQPAAPLQLIYERAFLCALPRTMWQQAAERYAALLPAGALLAGFFFFDENEKGPPFGITAERLDQLLSPNFERIADAPVSDSIPVFHNKERWQIWRRRSA